MRLAYAFLLCLACAPAGRTYERGSFVPPPPAPARPGVGAPIYEPHVRPLPPQPQPVPKRVLPETPETRRGPGIWATEAPKASADNAPSVKVLDVPMPVPYFAEPNMDHQVLALCRDNVLWGMNHDHAVGKLVWRLAWDERACWVARTMRVCARILMERYLADLREHGITAWSNDPHGRALNGLLRSSGEFRDVICPADVRRVDDAFAAWEKVAVITPKGAN